MNLLKGIKGWPGEDCRFFCVFLLFLSGELLGELWTQIPVRMAPGALQSCSTATVPLVAEMFLASYFCSALGFLQGIRQGCTTKIPTWAPDGKSLYKLCILWVFTMYLRVMIYNPPRIPQEHHKYHGNTVRDTPNCPLSPSFHKD